MSKKYSNYVFVIIKLMWLILILFAALALRVEILVLREEILFIDVDTSFMIERLLTSNIMLMITTLLCVKYV